MSDFLPGYDEWKTDTSELDLTAAEEAALIERYQEQKDELSDRIGSVLADYRGDLYLIDIRRIVIEELNALKRHPGEPEWMTAEPVKLP